MKRQYFGTDGVRGPYGGPVINETFAARLGAAAGRFFAQKAATRERRVFIGRDTRASGPALERAVAAGLAAQGFTPVALGVTPTPAVARAVQHAHAAGGAVITASHNPAGDNGIKFFGPNGVKLPDEDELRIEQLLPDGPLALPAPVMAAYDAQALYLYAVSRLLPAHALRGWKIVLDTANGATCETSARALLHFGAELERLGDAPDGHNINAGVGSQHPEKMSARVRASGARLGVAHDGDGDRCVLCDEQGGVLDGDEILTLLAVDALRRRRLARNTLVVTVHSNLGVDAAVAAAGGRVCRTAVGDRYVIERMMQEGARLGGESSGHIICAEVSPTGDGLVAALKVIGVMLATGRPLLELRRELKKFPQATVNLRIREKRDLGGLAELAAAIRSIEADFGPRGRVLVRYSGTEPKLRLLVEGDTDERVRAAMARLESAARRELEVV